MKHLTCSIFISAGLFLSSCSRTTYYVVRHAERSQSPANDPSLSEAGTERAMSLEERLKKAKIGYIFSTNTRRTKSTAEPLSRATGVQIQMYGPLPDSMFINKLNTLKKNVLIVGHSNTVDDIVNGLCGEVKIAGDLPETAYDNLFVVVKKRGKLIFRELKYGSNSGRN